MFTIRGFLVCWKIFVLWNFKFDSWIRNSESFIKTLRLATNVSYSQLKPSSTTLPSSLFFREKCTLLQFLNNKQNYSLHSLCNLGEIQLWLIKTNCFTHLLVQIKLLIIKIFTFKFENVVFTKLPKKLMIIKYTKWLNFLLIFIFSFYFEDLYSDTT